MKSNPYMTPGMDGMAVQYDPYVPRVQSSGKISYRDNIARMAVPVPYVEATHAQMLASPGDPAPAGAPAVAPAPAHQKPRGSATESAVLASLIAPVPLPQPQPDAEAREVHELREMFNTPRKQPLPSHPLRRTAAMHSPAPPNVAPDYSSAWKEFHGAGSPHDGRIASGAPIGGPDRGNQLPKGASYPQDAGRFRQPHRALDYAREHMPKKMPPPGYAGHLHRTKDSTEAYGTSRWAISPTFTPPKARVVTEDYCACHSRALSSVPQT